jgi:hypothetical protein
MGSESQDTDSGENLYVFLYKNKKEVRFSKKLENTSQI